MRTVLLDGDGLEDSNLDALQSVSDELTIYDNTGEAETASRIQTAEILITNKVRLTRALLQKATSLRLICVVATGTDIIDLKAAAEFGITVCNCQGYGTNSVVQHVFSSILALHTSLLQYHEGVRAGRWQQASQFCFLDYPILELHGKTLGIVGYGNLGKGVADIARAFGMEVIIAARPGSTSDTRPPLDDILPNIDVLTLHCPLTDATRGLINSRALHRMKPSAYLVNAARGGIVVEQDLLKALKDGEIAGAAIDVLSTEPPVDGNPLLDAHLANLIITPHVAWASREARQRIIDQTVENIEGYLSGSPIRVVGG